MRKRLKKLLMLAGKSNHYLNQKSMENQKVDDIISLEEASIISHLSQVHLRHLVSSGKLWGKKIGRNWVTSREAIENYIKKEKRPGRPPK